MTALQFLEKTYTGKEHNTRPRVTCNDGFSISIQGGTGYHYCDPRERCNKYYEVELGYPSEADDIIIWYAENKEDLTSTVYGFVPIETVESLIKKHGGILSWGKK
jgi:hypothetical protein